MIRWVSSADDPALVSYRHVADPAWLREEGLFVAEGRLVVDRLIALERFQLHSILVNRAAHDAMLERLARVETDVYVCSEETLASLTGFNFHRGCLALAFRPAPGRAERLDAGRVVLALEGVGNPDNVGGLFRTGAALGVDAVLLGPTAGDPLYRKAIRTSMGAALRLPFVRAADWTGELKRLKARGFTLVALTPSDGAVPLGAFAGRVGTIERLLLIVGAEGPGLQRQTLALADWRVRIPIEQGMDSLNVVVAAGIALDRLRVSGLAR
jgi:tRNA G18 (ribose-2'-O)-methylase SpoU